MTTNSGPTRSVTRFEIKVFTLLLLRTFGHQTTLPNQFALFITSTESLYPRLFPWLDRSLNTARNNPSHSDL
eukprot:m.400449 g.400449  ORF g.400449 m.400449 type:complete len:72 (-) comp16784_c0_seq5:4057-4272(-)